jgi:fructose-1-phosphate kinase PfkB-like protein
MADHYYSFAAESQVGTRTRSNVVVNTSTQTSNIELRVTDGQVTAKDVYRALERLADLFATRDAQVIAAGSLKQ